MATTHSSGNVRFGVFEIDLDSGELRKQGVKIKLHEQPFKILAMLLERPGEVVTRDELCQRLWPGDTFVESDLGLNSAIMKLRAALGDSAENPRFVETLPRRGYRLIVPVESLNGGPKHHLQSSSVPIRVPETQDPTSALDPAQCTSPVGAVSQSPPTGSRAKLPSWLKAVIAVTLIVAVATGLWRLLRPKPGPYVIAVLPLKNLNPDPGSDYFSDGLTDEIISNLSVIDGLQVKSQTSSFYFKDKPRDIHSIGNQLGVNMIPVALAPGADDKPRVNVQFVRFRSDYPLWSGRFERELKDIFAVQDEISRSVVNELRLKLGRGQRRYNTNLEAYDLYLKARALSPQYASPSPRKRLDASIALFEAAIAKDPNGAYSWWLGDSYAYLSAQRLGRFRQRLAYTPDVGVMRVGAGT